MQLRPGDASGLLGLRAILLSATILFTTCVASRAQETATTQEHPDAPSAAKSENESRRQNAGVAFFSMLQRKSIVFPDIATSAGPLSRGEKFQLFVNNSISLSVLFDAAASSAITQATNSPEGYGQGWDAYGKRFGSSMARNASSNFFGTFLLPSLLNQDPRFFPQKNPTLAGSIKYAVNRVFVTRSDAGVDTTNWSGLFGPLLAEGLANAYWPEQNRSAGETFQRYGVDIATIIGGNMLRNYWPVFVKKLGSSRSSGTRSK